MKAKQWFMVILVILVLAVVVYFALNKENLFNGDKNTTQNQSVVIPEKNVVYMTSSGFKPNLMIVKVGDTVTWYNNDTVEHWIASNPHLTHAAYPGSHIDKCGTSEEASIFDSCKGIAPGKTYSFTFNSRGKWNYHDHLDSGYISQVSVQ